MLFPVVLVACGGPKRPPRVSAAPRTPIATVTPPPPLPTAPPGAHATPAALVADDSDGLKAQLSADLPSIVEFLDPDCVKCKAMKPIVADLTARYTSRVRVYVVDIRTCLKLGYEYGINFTPTFMAFAAGGKPVGRELITSETHLAYLFEKWSAPPP